VTRLALTVPFHDDEHSDSFVSRVAAANGDILRIFLRNMGLDYRGLAGWNDDCFRKVAYLAGVEPASLIARAVRRNESGVFVAGEYVPKDRIHRFRYRYCPLCIEADVVAGSGVAACRPYGRLIWLVDFITRCPVHEAALAVAHEHHERDADWDFSRQMTVLRDVATSTSRTPTNFEIYAGQRLLGRPGHFSPLLDRHPLHVVVGLCEAVGAMDVHGVLPKKSEFAEENWIEIRQRGFEVLSGRPDAFREYVTTLADAARERTAMLKPRNIYGPVFSDLRRKLAHQDFDIFRQTIREVSIERLPVGPEDNIFGKLPSRKWHSLSSASKEFHITTIALRQLLTALNVIDESTHRKKANSFLIDALHATDAIRRFRAGLDEGSAMSYLDVPPHSWQAVLELSGIEPLPVKRRRGASGTLFDVTDLDTFVMRLAASGREAGPPNNGTGVVNVLDCRKVAECRLMDVLGLLFRGELRTVARLGTGPGLLSLHVDPAEVAAKAASLPGRTTPRHRVKEDHPLSPTNIAPLVEGGYLSTSLPLEEIADIRKADFMAWSVELFHERYRLLRDLAEDAGLEPRYLKRELSDAGVKPLLDENRITFAYYDIREVEAHWSTR
jgi:hypothetical protein